MLLLLASELRDIRRNILNSVLVTVCLGIGVMSTLVVHQLSVFIVDRFSDVGVQGTYDQIIDLHDRSESEYFELRKRWRQGELPNITHMVPIIQGNVEVQGRVIDVLGFDPIATLPSGTSVGFGLSQNTNFLTSSAVTAAEGGFQTVENVNDIEVTAGNLGDSRQLLADLPTAQHLLGRGQAVDAVWLRSVGTEQPWWDAVWPGLATAAKVPPTLIDIDGYQAIHFDWWNPSKQLGDAIVFNLGMLGLLTMLVAGFIVFQAMQTNLRQREDQVLLLNSLGLSSVAQRLLFIFRCAFFGLSGCILGVLMGLGVLAYVENATPFEAWQALDGLALTKAVVLGFGTALAVGCFTRQARSPRAAITLLGFSTVLALLGIVYGLWEGSGLLGASLLSVCFCLISIFCVVPVTQHAVLKSLRRISPSSYIARMNFRNAMRTTRDIRLAINALAIAVATAIGIGLMLASFRAEFSALLDHRLASDLHLSEAATLSEQEVRNWPGVNSIRTYRRGNAQLNGIPVNLVAADLDHWESQRYGYPSAIKHGVLINELAARRHQWQKDQLVTLRINESTYEALPILHVFKDYGEAASRVVVPTELVAAEALMADRYSIETAQPRQIRAKLAEQYPTIRVSNSDEIRSLAMRVFDTSFATAQIMVYVAIFVAVIGMACALIGVQTQRTKEMRLLTMMGTSRIELVKSALFQNALIGSFTVIVALPLSIALAWNLCYQVNPRAYGWSFDLDLSLGPIVIPCLLGILAAVLSGLEPLRRSLSRAISQPLTNVA